ncbi:hypothetical protein, partial [Leifsonella bigeumensis]|uniref:hypothetical protein n=1 Tax=Leifsonella bigeumensis TaxID=433643 RepID=UPI0031D2E175
TDTISASEARPPSTESTTVEVSTTRPGVTRRLADDVGCTYWVRISLEVSATVSAAAATTQAVTPTADPVK